MIAMCAIFGLHRYIRPTGLRFTKAHVTHPELQATFHLEILGVKKNPQVNHNADRQGCTIDSAVPECTAVRPR